MVFSSRQLRHSSPQTGDDFSTDTPFRLYDINHRSVTGARSPTVPTSTSIDTQPHRAVAILGAGNGVNGLPVQAAGPGTTDLIASAMSRTSLDDGEVPLGLLYGDESSLSSSMERERPLNPDLPNKNALFVFANFASYMRAPNEGSEDVKDAQLRHVQRLLEHARDLRDDPLNRVEVLHIKYRFPVISLENQVKLTPAPFATLMDPVVKLDYKQNGGFDPTPTAAILRHIAKHVNPPPRVIVYSYVGSKKTSTHLSTLAAFCDNRRVPITVLSPTETRIREHQPLEVALHTAIDMSLYASLPANWFKSNNLSFKRSQTGLPFWNANPSISGGSYLQAKEMALKAHGVSSSSYLSIRWKVEHDANSKIKVSRLSNYESLVDTLDLGDGPPDELETPLSDDLDLPDDLDPYALSPRPDLNGRQQSRISTSSSMPKGLGAARQPEAAVGTMFWRNMVVAHADPSNPEYVDANSM